MKRPLNPKQQAFVDYYEGNATEAARLAGYSDPEYGRQLITKPHVLQAIRERQNRASKRRVASREERQEFWTQVMLDVECDMRERLKASELLGKSEADFKERHQIDGELAITTLSEVVRAAEDHGRSGEGS